MHEAVQRSLGDELPIDEGADDGHLDYDDGDEDGLVLDDAEVYPPNHLSEKEKKQFHYLLSISIFLAEDMCTGWSN